MTLLRGRSVTYPREEILMPTKTSNNTIAPVFSLEQISYLERLYPEIWSENLSYSERCYNAGQRSVLAKIRQVSGVKYVPEYDT